MAESSPSFVCPHCGTGFVNGKALGGHISSAHVQPKRNLLDIGKETYTCPDPGCKNKETVYVSSKALHGHMRAHRDRDYRGMTPPKFYKINNASVSRVSMALDKKYKPVNFSNGSDKGEIVDLSDKAALMRGEEIEEGEIVSFSCNACNKSFPSHQALGGHVASHKQRTMKVYNTADDPRFDALKKRKLGLVKSNLGSSNKVQPTQAVPSPSPVITETRVVKPRLQLDFDLNFTPEEQGQV